MSSLTQLQTCTERLSQRSPNFFFFSRKSCEKLGTRASFGLSCRSLFSLQLQKRKEREEQLEDVIQAYEKIHMEKSNLQRDLDKMVRHLWAHHVTLMAKNQLLMRAKWTKIDSDKLIKLKNIVKKTINANLVQDHFQRY